MLVLGIESATHQVGVAIGGHEGVLASVHSAKDRRHAEMLTPQIEFACTQARVDLADIGVVAVDIGPGLFTGLRVGVASAKVVAQALGVPMIGITSLDLVAFPVRHSPRLIASCLDARRSEVFNALYRAVPGGIQRITPPGVTTPEEVASELETHDDDVLIVGDGGQRYADAFASVHGAEFAGDDLAYPSARSLVELAHPRALREEFVTVNEIEPLYLRQPDAEINWTSRDAL